eukprot:m.184327 g.184327  ORF g.184327 m.184327 type:complete len:533 (+) comp17485_c1_seq6:267-1865(+)
MSSTPTKKPTPATEKDKPPGSASKAKVQLVSMAEIKTTSKKPAKTVRLTYTREELLEISKLPLSNVVIELPEICRKTVPDGAAAAIAAAMSGETALLTAAGPPRRDVNDKTRKQKSLTAIEPKWMEGSTSGPQERRLSQPWTRSSKADLVWERGSALPEQSRYGGRDDDDEEELPEWATDGPVDRYDTIELVGMPGRELPRPSNDSLKSEKSDKSDAGNDAGSAQSRFSRFFSSTGSDGNMPTSPVKGGAAPGSSAFAALFAGAANNSNSGGSAAPAADLSNPEVANLMSLLGKAGIAAPGLPASASTPAPASGTSTAAASAAATAKPGAPPPPQGAKELQPFNMAAFFGSVATSAPAGAAPTPAAAPAKVPAPSSAAAAASTPSSFSFQSLLSGLPQDHTAMPAMPANALLLSEVDSVETRRTVSAAASGEPPVPVPVPVAAVSAAPAATPAKPADGQAKAKAAANRFVPTSVIKKIGTDPTKKAAEQAAHASPAPAQPQQQPPPPQLHLKAASASLPFPSSPSPGRHLRT